MMTKVKYQEASRSEDIRSAASCSPTRQTPPPQVGPHQITMRSACFSRARVIAPDGPGTKVHPTGERQTSRAVGGTFREARRENRTDWNQDEMRRELREDEKTWTVRDRTVRTLREKLASGEYRHSTCYPERQTRHHSAASIHVIIE